MPDIGLAPAAPPISGLSDGADHAHAFAILDGLTRGLISCDDRECVRFANQAALDMLGVPPGPPVAGRALLPWLGESTVLDRPAIATIHEAAVATVRDGRRRQFVVAAGLPPRNLAVNVLPLADGTSLLRIEDISRDIRDDVARALREARHDALTGLPGRGLFSERLVELLDGGPGPLAVLMVDLDRFKAVNDTLGHPVGDELLRLAARRMQSVLGEADLLTRFGGDEFGILLAARDEAAVEGVARSLVEIVGRPYLACGYLVNIGASVGIARAPDHASHAESLLKFADLALYGAKAAGRNGWAVFEPAMDARAHARRTLEIDLRRALTLRQFEVFYQPQIALDRTCLSGFEALVRWRHPERGLVSPAEFIPVAEEIGLIGAIGEWVLGTACREAAGWPAELTLAVNVSARQFEDGQLVDTVRRALAASGLEGHRLELEITESVLMRDEMAAIDMLHALRALDIRVAMDDFGTGYSSLSQLRSFPFNKIKIDRSFVTNLAADGNDAIIRAITAMGASLGMSTIAEGVETSDELARIRAEGCNAVQGYFFSRPVPSAELPALIATLKEQAHVPA